MKANTKGIYSALASAFFLGMAPIFGKQAILLGLYPLTVVAVRTALAALLLLVVMLLFYRPYLFIYPAGLLGCLVAGWTNGLGSLFYYSALGRINAGLGHLLYSLYPLFLVLWLSLDKQPPSRLTLLRLLLAAPAILLLVGVDNGKVDLVGVFEMLIASALYALHLPVNQRVLYDMPAPTVTLYTLLAMSAIVVPTALFSGSFIQANDINGVVPAFQDYLWPIVGLTLVTFLSRLTLFMGVKQLGGMQTALLGLSELLVAIFFAQTWLGERFTTQQWAGAILLVISLALVALEKPPPKKQTTGGFLSWLRPAGLTTETWQPHD
ncbi:MAG: DMT family transporter [Anaerolineales bacterium]|nr:DMT family transporter [Anaerolineales bacterium]